jgi:hypothetical protein
MEVLEFVARFGVVPRSAVARWAGTGKTATAVREKRLREASLLSVSRPWLSPEPVLVATREGLALCGRGELAVARASPSTLRHFSTAAHLAAGLERAGEELLSERELLAHERGMGERVFSIRLSGEEKYHRPDMVIVGEPPVVLEVELTAKGRVRLDEIVTSWSAAVDDGRFGAVRYLCSPEALPYVERSLERIVTGRQVTVEPLPHQCVPVLVTD